MSEGLVNLRTIRYFIVVAEEENLHRASERLRIAQPALTRQIKMLELDLGAILFERLPRGLKLTAAGESYLRDARNLMRMSVESSRRAMLVDRGFVGSIRLGFHEVAHRYLIFKKVLSQFMQDHGKVQFTFRTMSSPEQIDALLTDDLDAGFVYLWNPLPPQLNSIMLRRDHYLVALPPKHRLVGLPSVTLSMLRDEAFIWVDRSRNLSQSDTLMTACARADFIPQIVHEGCNSEASMLSLISIGAGIAFLPASLEESDPPVALVPVSDLNVHVELHQAFRTDRKLAVLERLIECTNSILANDGNQPVDI
ncbi:MAG: transcriptional regulator, LysR family [Sphingomonadales bacterium]|nr:transcriptional regulator, LysR family [Sphingomonadales bacterium]